MSNVIEKPETAIAEPPRKAVTVRTMVQSEQFKAAIGEVMPQHLTPERMVRLFIAAANKVPKLMECSQESVASCMMDLSRWGLEPDGRHAHLIPYEDRKAGKVVCQLIVDYKGLVQLAYRTGNVAKIHADKVCENDVFEVDRGEVTRHQIDYRKPRGAAYAFYCIIKGKDGSEKTEVMTLEEVQAIRSRSRSGGSGPWATDFDEMAKKTVFRRASKWIELSSEIRDAYDREDEIEGTVIHRGPSVKTSADIEALIGFDE